MPVYSQLKTFFVVAFDDISCLLPVYRITTSSSNLICKIICNVLTNDVLIIVLQGKAFQTAIYNQTVTITELEEGLDGET